VRHEDHAAHAEPGELVVAVPVDRAESASWRARAARDFGVNEA
jgi:hypothetical protein